MDTCSKQPQIKSKKSLIQTIILIGIAALIVFVFFTVTSTTKAKEKAAVLQIQGSIKLEEVTLNSKIAGNIEKVIVSEGDIVKKGDPLLQIDSSALEAKKLQAEGAVAAAKATAEKAANGARNQEVIQAKAAFDYAQKTYDRVKSLYEEGAVSANTYDETYAKYTAAQQTYNMALEGARSEDVSAANALVAQAEGALAEVNSYLEDCIIKAPDDGTITAINVESGELVSTGMALASLSSNKTPWIEVSVEENLLSNVSLNQEVPVTLTAYPDKTFIGQVTKISQQPDFATKRATNNNGEFDILSYRVTVTLDNLDVDVFAGMTAVVDFSKKAGNAQ
ncbi:HlyD family secretion protein [Sinanaerobacter sp. ZZT-01]|uniref:HlyD family secretion protein n=1 Tax=Sinanaerobacter sp. ZZT-01 TaxID=3111540 RepID=UPI002D777410|nr:efflux RND transporter periplasmic adaptor subunit [Sinanaerobacter sp. ZZT-01]WRR94869.1 efflux RND transporter periplasmic adaptor subunit [Sinanaerobacter sp. ZZT-01]